MPKYGIHQRFSMIFRMVSSPVLISLLFALS
jgi:hypothetical protein